MCSHPDHEVTELPDGQVDETHVFTFGDFQAFEACMRALVTTPPRLFLATTNALQCGGS